MNKTSIDPNKQKTQKTFYRNFRSDASFVSIFFFTNISQQNYKLKVRTSVLCVVVNKYFLLINILTKFNNGSLQKHKHRETSEKVYKKCIRMEIK